MQFGTHVRSVREALRSQDRRYSVRQVSGRVGIEPAYLSKIERGDVAPPGEETIRKLAADLGENPDVLLAMAGKLSTDLKEIICERPELLADLLRQLKALPTDAIVRIAREVRDGNREAMHEPA